MSAQALGAQAVGGAQAGELAAAQRVQQLQALIEASRQVATSGPAALTGGPTAVTGGPTAAMSGSTAATSGSAAATGSSPAGDPAAAVAQGTSGDFASALQAAASADASAQDEPAAASTTSYASYQPGVAGLPSSAVAQTGLAQPGAQAGAGMEGGEYEAMIDQAAARNGLDPAVLHGLIEQESGFDPTAVSGAGAQGLTQLMPGTAASLGVANPLDPAEAIEGGARYLGEMMARFGGNAEDALAAYNAGPAAVARYGGVPPYAETESYVTKVLANAEAYRATHPQAAAAGAI